MNITDPSDPAVLIKKRYCDRCTILLSAAMAFGSLLCVSWWIINDVYFVS